MKAEEIRQNTMDRQRCLVYQKIESAMEDGKFFLFYSNINCNICKTYNFANNS